MKLPFKGSFILIIFFSLSSFLLPAQNYNPISIFPDHEGEITTMTRDPSGQVLIAGDENGFLYFHDLSTGQLLNKVKAHGAPVTQLQFNSNGKLLISATRDGEIKIYDLAKQKIIQSIFSPNYSGIRFVLFSIAD